MRRDARAPFSKRAVGLVAGVIGGSFVLALVLAGRADDLGAPRTASNNTFSVSAIGHRGFLRFLERLDVEVVVRRTARPSSILAGAPFLIAEPPGRWLAGVDGTSRFEALLEDAHRREAAPVVVLPKWSSLPDLANPRWISEANERWETRATALERLGHRIDGLADVEPRADGTFPCETAWGESYDVELSKAALLAASDEYEPIVWCDTGTLVARHVDAEGNETFLVSDPDVLNNQGIGRAEHAALLAGLAREALDLVPGTQLVVDETVHGFERNPGIMGELMRFPLALATLHVGLLLGIALWSGVVRFGSTRRPEPAVGTGREVLIANTAKLVGLGPDPGISLAQYFRLHVSAVARHYHLPAELSMAEIIERLDEVEAARGQAASNAQGGGELPRLEELRNEVHLLSGGSIKRPERILRSARAIHRWRKGMTHDDR